MYWRKIKKRLHLEFSELVFILIFHDVVFYCFELCLPFNTPPKANASRANAIV